jgi:hypothetical protein
MKVTSEISFEISETTRAALRRSFPVCIEFNLL